MKTFFLIFSFILVGCSHEYRGPASVDGEQVAHDAIELGDIKASAYKSLEGRNVCFDITVVAKNVEKQTLTPDHWSASWIDSKNEHHTLNLQQRAPVLVPQGGTIIAPYGAYQEWSNNFKSCISKTSMNNIRSVILESENDQRLVLTWK